jgi:hypothetical protein
MAASANPDCRGEGCEFKGKPVFFPIAAAKNGTAGPKARRR